MATTPNPLAALGVPYIAPGKRLSPLNPGHVGQPPNKDHFGARELLVHLRTLDPSFKAPKEQKRGFLSSKKKKEDLDDPSSWSFTPRLGGQSLLLCARMFPEWSRLWQLCSPWEQNRAQVLNNFGAASKVMGKGPVHLFSSSFASKNPHQRPKPPVFGCR